MIVDAVPGRAPVRNQLLPGVVARLGLHQPVRHRIPRSVTTPSRRRSQGSRGTAGTSCCANAQPTHGGCELLRRAMAYGTVLAAFNVEAFGPDNDESPLARWRSEIVREVRERGQAIETVTSPVLEFASGGDTVALNVAGAPRLVTRRVTVSPVISWPSGARSPSSGSRTRRTEMPNR